MVWKNALRSILRISIVFAVFGALIMFFPGLVRSLLYFPSQMDSSGRGGNGFLPYRNAEGDFLGYIQEHRNAGHTVIIFHGNGGEALHRSWYAEPLRGAAVHIILAEYPGYGAVPGSPSESSIFAAADRIIQEARKFGRPIILVGESLGSGVACYTASKHTVERLALISPFSSVLDAARFHYGWIAVGALLPDKYESTGYLKKYNGPLHIIHGTEDEVVPIALGKKLFEAYPGPRGVFTEIPGYHHNDIAEAIIDDPRAASFRAFIRGE